MITMAAMAALNVRSGSLPFARPTRRAADRTFQRMRANRRERSPAFAMQKVVGSSPIIRVGEPPTRVVATDASLDATHRLGTSHVLVPKSA
jgi:hypothetical protein